jgi:methylenetetrahydrofolate dehydrogenase (NADP+)/methenyltetrahydrofolate cyclohydrolase
MTAKLLKGKPVATAIREEVARDVAELKRRGICPNLTVVLVGEDPASQVYVGNKGKACRKAGIESNTISLPETTSHDELMAVVSRLNRDRAVHGILVQLPLPQGVDENAIICAIDPKKDVDGFTPENLGKLMLGSPYTVACTPAGIVELLERYEVPIEGSNVVIIGRSSIVGKPLGALLVQKEKGKNCTVTICHSRTKDIRQFTRNADIVVTAMGHPRFLKADMVTPGCTIVDVGVNRIDDPASPRGYVLAGDADFEALTEVASFITPVPGGVGPLTVAMLLKNTVKVARSSQCEQ